MTQIGGGGVVFLTFLTTPTLKKKWVSSVCACGGGGLGGFGPKTHWGMCLLDKKMILHGDRQTIQPLEVGYANRAKKGGGVAFPPRPGLI